MRPRIIVPALTAAIVAIAPACTSSSYGNTNASSSETRTLDIDMKDIAFSPSHITVPAGEPVRLVFHNRDTVQHDAFVGDARAQTDHDAEMSSSSSMGGMDNGVDHLTVQPGGTGTLTHTFEAGDDVLIGCHEPGHYDAGMKLTVATS